MGSLYVHNNTGSVIRLIIIRPRGSPGEINIQRRDVGANETEQQRAISGLKEENSELMQQVEHYQMEIDRQDFVLEDAAKEINSLKKNYQILQTTNENLLAKIDKLKIDLQKLKKGAAKVPLRRSSRLAQILKSRPK